MTNPTNKSIKITVAYPYHYLNQRQIKWLSEFEYTVAIYNIIFKGN